MLRISLAPVCALVLAATVACVPEDDPEITPRSESQNGWQINGWQINGWQINGWQINGWQINGWQINGWQINGAQIEGGVISATQTINGVAVKLTGPDLIGATFQLTSGGTTYALRIDDIFKDPALPNGDVYFYRISVRDDPTNTWSSLCYDIGGSPTEAIPLAGRWDAAGAHVDDGSITLACRSYVLAKCVEWGYRPWASAQVCSQGQCPVVPLRDYHQACTRMARADYCGDGQPHTIPGTPIDIYDKLAMPIQIEGTKSLVNWQVEAEWGPTGARCVGDALRLHLLDDLDIPYVYPTCIDTLHKPNCGSFAANGGALIANKYCEPWVQGIANCGGNYEGQEKKAGP